MSTYKLLNDTKLQLVDLTSREQEFLHTLKKMASERVSYFEIYRLALGPGSPALRGRTRVDKELAKTPLYQVVRDLATRAGIEQGLILAPEYQAERARALEVDSPLSVAQAAQLIGISRMAAYKAIKEGRLGSVLVGNVLVVKRADAEKYKRDRGSSGGSDTGRMRGKPVSVS